MKKDKTENVGGACEVSSIQLLSPNDSAEGSRENQPELLVQQVKQNTSLSPKVSGSKKPCRRSYLRDENAPKFPRSAYILFLCSRKELLEKDESGEAKDTMTAWAALSPESKQPFYDRAAADRERHAKELSEYKKTDLYRQFQEKKALWRKSRLQKRKQLALSNGNDEEGISTVALKEGDIPIYSSQFLEYNKEQEAKLKATRQRIGALERESDLLKGNIARLETSIAKLMKQQLSNADNCQEIFARKTAWSEQLTKALADIEIPGVGTIDKDVVAYMAALRDMDPKEDNDLTRKIRAALSHVVLQ